jgi:hypothetical protein
MAWWLLAASVDGRWRPGIGDPDFLGWFTTVAYLLAAGACAWAWRREVRGRAFGAPGLVPGFWLALAVGMFALGVNKQLDLQSWFTQVGKDLAKSEGWYARRRPVQVAFIGGVAMVGVAGVGAVTWWLRGSFRRYRVALAGVVYLACFVVIRAASFHHIDRLLHVGLEHVRLNHVLELGGIGFIAWGAARAITGTRPPDGRTG